MAKTTKIDCTGADTGKRREGLELLHSLRQSLSKSKQFAVERVVNDDGTAVTTITENGLQVGETAESVAAAKKAQAAADAAAKAAQDAAAEAAIVATEPAGGGGEKDTGKKK